MRCVADDGDGGDEADYDVTVSSELGAAAAAAVVRSADCSGRWMTMLPGVR